MRSKQRSRSAANALLLVPEIALTPAVAGQFYHRFGDRVAILHSAFHDSERAEQWRRIRNGQARVVVGTRSGVFAPVQNLGLIIIDEEHDGSYKQQDTPRYNGRDVAVMRAHQAEACVVLVRDTEPRNPLQRRARQIHSARIAGACREPSDAGGGTDRHEVRSSWKRASRHILAAGC